jgi:hypothetical protein
MGPHPSGPSSDFDNRCHNQKRDRQFSTMLRKLGVEDRAAANKMFEGA